MELLLILVGLAQIGLCVSTLFLPKLLNWKEAFASLALPYRQNFFVYAGYILAINMVWGLLSLFYNEDLLSSSLGQVLLLVMALYWIVRLLLQLFYFDMSLFTQTFWMKAGEWGLNLLFLVLSTVYSITFISTLC